jgi:hypothetical protein
MLRLIGIVGMLTVAGHRAALMLSRARDRLRAHWPVVLAGVALLAGICVVTIGVTGLTSHTPFGRFVRNRLFLAARRLSTGQASRSVRASLRTGR